MHVGLASGICTLLNESHSPTTYVPMSTQQCVGVQPSERVWAGGSLWATIKVNTVIRLHNRSLHVVL